MSESVSVTDPDVIKAAETAFEFYKKVTPRLNDLSLHEVATAEKQTAGVEGYNYIISFRTEAADVTQLFSIICNAVVHVGPESSDFQTIEIECNPKLTDASSSSEPIL